jgi:signal transduction histidine kinase
VDKPDSGLQTIADYLADRREAILRTWRESIKSDPALTTGDSLPRIQLLDHIPEVLLVFDSQLRSSPNANPDPNAAVQEPAAAHGLLRWQQGYNLSEVTRELGKLNGAVLAELSRFTLANPSVGGVAISRAYGVWAAICSAGVEESVTQYFALQQIEAAGQVEDLEKALVEIRQIEDQRADLWQQAAHDLRGNLGVVANATVGLTNPSLPEVTREKFTRMLMRNVTSLHHLLDDVTSLARLQAGRENRRIESMDVTPMLRQLCEGIGELAHQRQLFLRCEGPEGFGIEGDPVKIRRIAQNLILNAVKYTEAGEVLVTWGDSEAGDAKRWALSVKDTGPGFPTGSGRPLTSALENASQIAQDPAVLAPESPSAPNAAPLTHQHTSVPQPPQPPQQLPGEGIGLSIVKRLCELLDATIEIESTLNVGTTIRILFPRTYSS